MRHVWRGCGLVAGAVCLLFLSQRAHAGSGGTPRSVAAAGDWQAVAGEVDRLIEEELATAGTEVAPPARDEDFLRRVTLDLAGTIPTPEDVTLFGLDPSSGKRGALIDRLLESDEYARNWAGYWREVIFSRATNMRARLAQGTFEAWMAEQLRSNRPWDEIAAEVITATGDVTRNGQTALVFAQEAVTEDVAAEVSRIFLGIQIQCASCHDHPTDRWKREQFHQLAAFFPRIQLRPVRDGQMLRSFEVVSFDQDRRGRFAQDPERLFRFLDRNGDGRLTKREIAETQFARVFDQLLERGDSDKDQALSLQELKEIPPPQMAGRGATEHFMPDLDNPESRGTRIDPVFFVDERQIEAGLSDAERRQALAQFLTAEDNPWFARAYVNRMWTEMLGEGFYTPVDDLGPDRTPQYPQALDTLCEGFVASGCDVKWLFRTIANTRVYQREIQTRAPADGSFAAAAPTRLRADQLFSAILQATGSREPTVPQRGTGPAGFYQRARSPRAQFNALFGFDPSTPQSDVTGEVPQALFMMNSPQVNGLARADGRTRLGQIVRDFPDNEDAVAELYLLVLGRQASEREGQIALAYINDLGNRDEAFEDLLWSLLNSTEFLTKR